MAGDADGGMPDVAAALAAVLQRVPRQRQPILIAQAERQAAARYRGWAEAADPRRRAALLDCAAREEEIARRIESLFADAAALRQAMIDETAEAEAFGRQLFADRSMEQQFAIQAGGERLGAATWRSFARHATSPEARETFLACALLEEQSAEVLEGFLGGGPEGG